MVFICIIFGTCERPSGYYKYMIYLKKHMEFRLFKETIPWIHNELRLNLGKLCHVDFYMIFFIQAPPK